MGTKKHWICFSQEKERAEYLLAFVFDIFESAVPELRQVETVTSFDKAKAWNIKSHIARIDARPEEGVTLAQKAMSFLDQNSDAASKRFPLFNRKRFFGKF